MDVLAPAVTRMNVLVVEDYVDTARLLAEFLMLDGHDVRIAYDGFAALRMASERPPDLVLLDVGLPKMDGYEIATTLRQQHGFAGRIVALSGFAIDQAKTQAAGIDDYHRKPVSLDTLHRVLAS